MDRGKCCRMHLHVINDRIEPSCDTAIQGIVITTLIMGLMTLRDDVTSADSKCCKSPAAIPASISHITIDAQIVPTGSKAIPIGKPGCLPMSHA